ncbi:KTSC domain-containing protein, partial [uncultured Sphingomonas sp.]|uniref:KTSC domain-containing protein n=1 Tax=uncultured Sphingomonas sp. TaxID=158754 RepID=UPI0025D13880
MLRARRLNSSMIDRIAHDNAIDTLSVWFKGRGKYLYHAVPRALYDALKTAESAGKLFNDHIRGRYYCEPDPARRRHRPD